MPAKLFLFILTGRNNKKDLLELDVGERDDVQDQGGDNHVKFVGDVNPISVKYVPVSRHVAKNDFLQKETLF